MTTMTTMSIALDLPELRVHLIPFLTRHDLTICARVSRDWNRTFEPCIWHAMSLVPKFWAGSNLLSETLFRHSSSIRKLSSAMMNTLWTKNLYCPNLNDLVIVGNIQIQEIDFIHRHRDSLEKIFLGTTGLRMDDGEPCDADDLWNVLASCASLQSLSIGNCSMAPQSWSICWPFWSRLKVLKLLRVELGILSNSSNGDQGSDGSSLIPQGLCLTTIQELELDLISKDSKRDELTLLKYCPRLEILTWVPDRNNFHKEQGWQLAEQARHCPKLHTVRILGDNTAEVVGLRPFLESRTDTRLKELKLSLAWITDASWMLLRERYSEVLQHLDLISACELKGCVIHDIMCSLANLKSFSARLIQDRDMDSRPWICLKLVKLTIGLEVVGEGWEIQRLIFERLGTFRDLSDLEILGEHAPFRRLDVDKGHFLHFILDGGLACLETLGRMEQLNFSSAPQVLSEKDVKWMLTHWPRLKYVYGPLNPSRSLNESLAAILKTGDVLQGHYGSPGVSII